MSNLKRIAEMAGVSVTTVSRILNHDPKMSAKPETRRRVLDVAEQMQYETPRTHREQTRAIAAESGRAKRLLVATSKSAEAEPDDPYYLGMCQGLDRVAAALGYHTDYVSALDDMMGVASFGALVGIGDEACRHLASLAQPDQVLATAETPGICRGEVLRFFRTGLRLSQDASWLGFMPLGSFASNQTMRRQSVCFSSAVCGRSVS